MTHITGLQDVIPS